MMSRICNKSCLESCWDKPLRNTYLFSCPTHFQFLSESDVIHILRQNGRSFLRGMFLLLEYFPQEMFG